MINLPSASSLMDPLQLKKKKETKSYILIADHSNLNFKSLTREIEEKEKCKNLLLFI